MLHNAPPRGSDLEMTGSCPLCHRPLSDPAKPTTARRGSTAGVQSGFVNPQYFRMLDSSLPPSEASTTPRSGSISPGQARSSPEYDSDAEFRPVPTPSSSGISATAFSPNYFKRFFVEERELGRGGKAVVLLVKHVLDGVELGQFACKRVPVGDNHRWLEKVLIEVQLLQNLSHPNLVSYRHVWLENARLSTFGPKVPCAFILQQYCNAGDLHKYVYGSPSAFPTPQVLKARMRRRSRGQNDPPLHVPRQLSFEEIYSFFKDITQGLRFLHANGYIHRDLKPSNCLLHKTGTEIRVLVSDFGEMQYNTDTRSSTGTTGTISYCAPEVLRRTSPGGPFGNFTFKSDIFSLGMILHFLCFDALPYENANIAEEEKEDVDLLRAEISSWNGFIPSRRIRPDLPEQLYKMLTLLLSADPSKRPTADEVLEMIQAPLNYNVKEGLHLHRPNNTPAAQSSPTQRVVAVEGSDESDGALSTAVPPPRTSGALVARKYSPPRAKEDEFLNRTPGSHTGIVLRSSVEPPPNYEEVRNAMAVELPPLLLPPTQRPQKSQKHFLSQSLRIFLLIFKILSLTQPCLPQAASSWVLYPTLFFAALDFGQRNVWFHLATLILHVIIISIASHQNALCFEAP